MSPSYTGIKCFEVRTREDLDRRAGEADVVVISGMWHNGLIDLAHNCASFSRSARARTSAT
jgi:hypothetical protein